MNSDVTWGKDSAKRLSQALKPIGTYEDIAIAANMPKPTLSKVLSGVAEPRASTLIKLCAVANVSAEYVVSGSGGIGSSELVPIPLYSLTVSAGDGVSAIEDAIAEQHIPFSKQWLKRKFGSHSGLRLGTVRGDSMSPRLSDGDWVMFDIDRRDPVDGIYVVRHGDMVMIKNVLFEGPRVQLVSHNPIYQPIVVDAASDDFSVIGRAIWAAGGI